MAPKLAFGDGALGFWALVKPASCACRSHVFMGDDACGVMRVATNVIRVAKTQRGTA